uniref:Tetraspanin n=1 Tax=Schistosoma japonicum TaxID=6182 RepID=C1L759_SCHJA|nr:25 kDa integral membrane protein [Schistosoma japonicum]
MELTLSQQFWTKLFFLLNSLFGIFGIVLLAFGIKGYDILVKFNIILQGTIPVIFPITIFLGCLLLLSTLIGFIGLWKPKQFIVIMHIAIVFIAVLGEICIASITISSIDQFHSTVNSSLLQAVKGYYSDKLYEEQMDRLQSRYMCCGATSYRDYDKAHSIPPFSCLTGYLVYSRGCAEAINSHLQRYVVALISLCYVFAFIKIIYVFISMILLKRFYFMKNSLI